MATLHIEFMDGSYADVKNVDYTRVEEGVLKACAKRYYSGDVVKGNYPIVNIKSYLVEED